MYKQAVTDKHYAKNYCMALYKDTLVMPPTLKAALERVKKIPYAYIGKNCLDFFSAVYDSILMILTVNEDMHKSLDEFEFGQYLKTDCKVSCP